MFVLQKSKLLNKICTDKDLIEIAKELDKWETVWASLSITEPEVTEIQKNYQADYLAQKINVLMRWKKNCQSNATFAALSEVFRAVGNALMANTVEELSQKSNEIYMLCIFVSMVLNMNCIYQ